jgi:hypothetical protein
MMMNSSPVHFHSSDDRFCGSTQPGRQFSLDQDAVTCPGCKGQDTLVLTPQGAAYVASLDAAMKSGTRIEWQVGPRKLRREGVVISSHGDGSYTVRTTMKSKPVVRVMAACNPKVVR